MLLGGRSQEVALIPWANALGIFGRSKTAAAFFVFGTIQAASEVRL
jgi:hypothetical protein